MVPGMSPRVHSLNVYPVKSMAGVPVTEARVTPRGLEHDRRFMVVDAAGRLLTQRELPRLALVGVGVDTGASAGTGTLSFTSSDPTATPLAVPLAPAGPLREVEIWGDRCAAVDCGPAARAWLTSLLGQECALVWMPDDTRRPVDPARSEPGDVVSFADAFPLLAASCASLDDLNARLVEPVPMNRFRPNVVFDGLAPFGEDDLGSFTIGDVAFRTAGPCDRCVVTCTDQATGARGNEPLKTLATYRLVGKKILFGQNVLTRGTGVIRVGDPVVRRSPPRTADSSSRR